MDQRNQWNFSVFQMDIFHAILVARYVVTSSTFLFCSCLETDATFQVPRKRGITVMLDLKSASSYSSQWNLVKQTKKIKVFYLVTLNVPVFQDTV